MFRGDRIRALAPRSYRNPHRRRHGPRHPDPTDPPPTARTDVDMTSNPSVSVLIADDHAIFRASLRELLESEPGFRVAGEAADGAEAVTLTRRLQPDILLLDIAMPHLPGLEALRRLNGSTNCRSVVLTAHIENAQLVEAMRIGARGVMMKDSSVELLFKGIRAVMAGEYWVGRERVADLTQYFRAAPRDAHATKQTFGLTPRERQVICAVVAGYTNRDIAQHLSISQDTTKHHLSNIFDKLGVSNRLELALFACNHSIVDGPFGAAGSSTSSAENFR